MMFFTCGSKATPGCAVCATTWLLTVTFTEETPGTCDTTCSSCCRYESHKLLAG